MTIKTSEITSIGIKIEAEKAGIESVELIGCYDHPSHPCNNDYRLKIYEVGPVRVAETNGDPIWEENDFEAFAALLSEYGIG